MKKGMPIEDNTADLKVLRTGDRARVRLEFKSRFEYLEPNLKLIFREGRVKAVGKVLEII
jgi:GTPase